MNISAKRALVTGRSSGIGRACAIWVATMALASTASWSAENDGDGGASRAPVVVELFQSQGCSDCPPAQEDLNRLADSPNILALSYGVTYWDYLGWKDSFASPQFTQRQVDYSARNHGIGVATPQYTIALPGDAADGLKSAVLIQAGAGGPILAATKF